MDEAESGQLRAHEGKTAPTFCAGAVCSVSEGAVGYLNEQLRAQARASCFAGGRSVGHQHVTCGFFEGTPFAVYCKGKPTGTTGSPHLDNSASWSPAISFETKFKVHMGHSYHGPQSKVCLLHVWRLRTSVQTFVF